MVDIELDLQKALYNKLKEIFPESYFVVGTSTEFDPNDKSKVYIWFQEVTDEHDFFDRTNGTFYIDINVSAINTEILDTVNFRLFDELDKTSIDRYNFMATLLNNANITFPEVYNGITYNREIYPLVMTGGYKVYLRYDELPASYSIMQTGQIQFNTAFSIYDRVTLDLNSAYSILNQSNKTIISQYTITMEAMWDSGEWDFHEWA